MSTGLSQGKTGTDRTTNIMDFFKGAALGIAALAVPGCDKEDVLSVSMPRVHRLTLDEPLIYRAAGDVVKIDLPRAELRVPDHQVRLSGVLGLKSDTVFVGGLWSDEQGICNFISDKRDINPEEALAVVTIWREGSGPRLSDELVLDFRKDSLRRAGIYPSKLRE